MSSRSIQLTVLGGGQSIGKSCFLVSVGDQHVLLDCGSFVGRDTKKALPDFSKLPRGVKVDDIAVVLISHFHMDHVGGLFHLTEQLKYKGRILMSAPTRAILPLILNNNRVLLASQLQTPNSITAETCATLTKRVEDVSLRETISINSHLKVTAHAAGHVLGAVMWEVEMDGKTILYTGDFSDEEGGFIPPYELPSRYSTPGNLDMLIMECTYGNTQFQSLEQRRNAFVRTILSTIRDGGRVLVPCYGIGYTQELLALLQEVWSENHLTIPIYYSSQDTYSILPLYSLFSAWTTRPLAVHSEQMKLFRMDFLNNAGPFVLLAAHPSMTTGVSKAVFPSIAKNPKNCVIFLGNNPSDTFAGQIMKENARLNDGKDTPIVCKRKVIPFSSHPDRTTESDLIQKSNPQCVVLVHGDKNNCTGFVKSYCKSHSKYPLFLMPDNGKTVEFTPEIGRIPVDERDEWQIEKRRRTNDGTVVRIRDGVLEYVPSLHVLEVVEKA